MCCRQGNDTGRLLRPASPLVSSPYRAAGSRGKGALYVGLTRGIVEGVLALEWACSRLSERRSSFRGGLATWEAHASRRAGVVLVSATMVGGARHAACAWVGVASTPRKESSMVQAHRSISTHQRQVLRQRARVMRHAPTETEHIMWQALRAGRLGVTFRRQVVLQGYIADFYACSAKLVVEVDGNWHAKRQHRDARRERTLRAAGYRILHVTTHEVVHSLPQVLARVLQALSRS